MGTDAAIEWVAERVGGPGADVGLALRTGVGLGVAIADDVFSVGAADPASVVAGIEAAVAPRWVWLDRPSGPDPLAAAGVRVARCWDVLTVHRLLQGGWRTSVALAWARLHDLAADGLPSMGQLGLLDDHGDDGGDPEQAVRPDGYLRPEWVEGGWGATPQRLARWAASALEAAARQRRLLDLRPHPDRAHSTARSESAAELLCAELEVDGLPIDTVEAERLITEAAGPRPIDEAHADELRRARDAEVVALLGPGRAVDLRNPADVKAMLRTVGLDLPDTRAWRLERHQDDHPLVAALLKWRKAERIATTYGWRWLDEHVHAGRLRGEWSSCDGAAGRMTASAGLHNLPAELRPAVAAEAGHVFVRADLGQIEPRVLAAVSGDAALIAATADDDLYQPVATRLGVTRDVAKVAVLGAMYGSTTGRSAHALRGLEDAYPTAMGVLEAAARAGAAGEDVYTIGGRRVRMWVDRGAADASSADDVDASLDRARSVAAARGRFARNALIQGAAAELFKVWAVTVRARAEPLAARIVLCLHDELLLHVPEERARDAVALVGDALDEAAYRWSPARDVRFLADVTTVRRWSEAK